jgi:hypothetical protein
MWTENQTILTQSLECKTTWGGRPEKTKADGVKSNNPGL